MEIYKLNDDKKNFSVTVSKSITFALKIKKAIGEGEEGGKNVRGVDGTFFYFLLVSLVGGAEALMRVSSFFTIFLLL